MMRKHRNQETHTSGFKIRGIEKRGLNHDPKSGITQRPAPPEPIETRPPTPNRSPTNDQ